jgi:hypothetical protein
VGIAMPMLDIAQECFAQLQEEASNGLCKSYNPASPHHLDTSPQPLSTRVECEASRAKEEPCGHDSVKIMVDIYGHLMPGFNEEAVNRPPRNGNHRDNRNREAEESPYERTECENLYRQWLRPLP